MNEIAAILPENDFIRIHRSSIVAFNKTEKISGQEITIAGTALSLGVSYEEKMNEIRQKRKMETGI